MQVSRLMNGHVKQCQIYHSKYTQNLIIWLHDQLLNVHLSVQDGMKFYSTLAMEGPCNT